MSGVKKIEVVSKILTSARIIAFTDGGTIIVRLFQHFKGLPMRLHQVDSNSVLFFFQF